MQSKDRQELQEVEKIIEAAIVKATPSYMKKEAIREKLQGMIMDAVRTKDVSTQKELDDLFQTFDMATNTLKSVPIEVYKKMTDSD